MTQHILELLCKTLPDGSILLTAFHCDHISWSPSLFISPSSKNTSPLLQSIALTLDFSLLHPFGHQHLLPVAHSVFPLLRKFVTHSFSVLGPIQRPLNLSPLPLHTSFILSPTLFLLLISFFSLSIFHSVLHSFLLSQIYFSVSPYPIFYFY